MDKIMQFKESGFELQSHITFKKEQIIIHFKGSIFKVDFSLYSDSLIIKDISFICYVIDKYKGNYEYKFLKRYDVEYKQIEVLLKEYFLNEGL